MGEITEVSDMTETVAGHSPSPEPDAPVVRVSHLAKRFRRADGTVVRAIDDVSFDVHPGEMVVLVGPSGCGKTTLLRSIAGLEVPDSGLIQIHGVSYFSSNDRVNVPPERRRVSMVFQNYALWPHMTAFQNVVYPLRSSRAHRVPKKQAAEQVHRVLELVGIPDLARQYPHQMSGGQRQRVALARALVAGTDLVLFDEPLSNVDAKVRTQLRLELLSMQRELGFSAVFVTHDQIEAMELAHSIAVMGDGKIRQYGTPREVYDTPTSHYVANFIGTTNEVAGTVTTRDADHITLDGPFGEMVGTPGEEGIEVGDEVVGIWRPEATLLSSEEPTTPNRWTGVLTASLYLGSHTEQVVEIDGHPFRAWFADPELTTEGSRPWVSVTPEQVRVLRATAAPSDESDPSA